MSDQMEILQGFVNDMLAVEPEIHNAFSRQKHSDKPKAHPEAAHIIARIEETIDGHIVELQRTLERIGGSESTLKKAVGVALGAVAGLYDQVRDEVVSRMVRDDLAALNFTVACYQMLHTTALAMHDQALADVALKHLKDFTPLIMDLSQVLPSVVVSELAADNQITIDASVAEEAVESQKKAWEEPATVH
ncbi:MAG: DUF892 family protein [Candidatus Binatia bacterium]